MYVILICPLTGMTGLFKYTYEEKKLRRKVSEEKSVKNVMKKFKANNLHQEKYFYTKIIHVQPL